MNIKAYMYFMIEGKEFKNGTPEYRALMAVFHDRLTGSMDETNKLKKMAAGLENKFQSPGQYSEGVIKASQLLGWAWGQDLLQATHFISCREVHD